MEKKRLITTIMILVLVSTVSFAIGFTASGDFVNGAAAVWNDGTSEFQSSGTATAGMVFILDGNTVCFNGTTCDVNVDWNGTDIIING